MSCLSNENTVITREAQPNVPFPLHKPLTFRAQRCQNVQKFSEQAHHLDSVGNIYKLEGL